MKHISSLYKDERNPESLNSQLQGFKETAVVVMFIFLYFMDVK